MMVMKNLFFMSYKKWFRCHRSSILVVVASLFFSDIVFAQSKHDRKAVEAAVLDYVEGFYLVQPDRIERSVSRSLSKVGYVHSKEGYREIARTYEQLHTGSKRYNAKGHINLKTASKEIEILDILDQIAVVKLSAEWGVDYLNLAKKEGRWMIVKVIWQTYPEKTLQ